MPYLADALSLAQWIAGRRSDAEDIVQDACLRAFRHQASLAGDNPRAWLLAIVRNAAYAWLRRNRTPGVIFLDDLDAGERTLLETGDGADMAPTPEAELLRKADAQELERALEALPLHLRESVILRDVQGLSYREIAQVTEQPLGTVMSRLARGRRRLMQSLAGGKPDAA